LEDLIEKFTTGAGAGKILLDGKGQTKIDMEQA